MAAAAVAAPVIQDAGRLRATILNGRLLCNAKLHQNDQTNDFKIFVASGVKWRIHVRRQGNHINAVLFVGVPHCIKRVKFTGHFITSGCVAMQVDEVYGWRLASRATPADVSQEFGAVDVGFTALQVAHGACTNAHIEFYLEKDIEVEMDTVSMQVDVWNKTANNGQHFGRLTTELKETHDKLLASKAELTTAQATIKSLQDQLAKAAVIDLSRAEDEKMQDEDGPKAKSNKKRKAEEEKKEEEPRDLTAAVGRIVERSATAMSNEVNRWWEERGPIAFDPSQIRRVTVEVETLLGGFKQKLDRFAAKALITGQCSVCMDKKPSVVITPCGHYCLCCECAGRIKSAAEPKCPICRGAVKEMQKVFMS